MPKRDFDEWLSKFKISIADYKYYVDFNKVYQHISQLKIELNILNSLIGSKNIEIDFKNLLNQYPEVIKCIPILLAVRAYEIHIHEENKNFIYNFKQPNYSIENYITFMSKTGLFNLMQNHLINNLIDYVTGVEVGLDTNGRKNRGGHLMEDLVEKYIVKSGYVKDETYFKEMQIKQIEQQFNLNLSAMSNHGKTVKRFDFVIKSAKSIYGIEANFYNGGGSKLNETARSYKQIAQESKQIQGFEFLWITDGHGWISAKNNLEETFDIMEHIYSINDLENDVLNKVIK